MKKCPKKSSAFKIVQKSQLHVMAHVIFRYFPVDNVLFASRAVAKETD